MPNYCQSLLTITGDSDVIENLEQAMFSSEDGKTFLDFNKIVPMPGTLSIRSGGHVEKTSSLLYPKPDSKEWEIEDLIKTYSSNFPEDAVPPVSVEQIIALLKQTPEGRLKLLEGHLYHRNLKQYGYSDWYSWRRAHWGTKWKIVDFERLELGRFSFSTAWSPPTQVIAALAEQYPMLKFNFIYVELGCWFAGVQEWFNGELSFSNEDGCDVANIAKSYFGYEDEDLN